MEAKHTPGPWHAPGLCEVHAPDHRLICDTSPNNNDPEDEIPRDECEANARRIAKCVNAHDALVAILADAVPYIDAATTTGGDPFFVRQSLALADRARAVLIKARA
jgi:hypothetical protein